MSMLNVPPLYLPNFQRKPPPSPMPFLPIFCTPQKKLRQKRNVVVIVGDSREDIGILSYRLLSKEAGIQAASVVSLVKKIQLQAFERVVENKTDFEEEMPGIVVLNPGQLLFSHTKGRAMSQQSWDALPRQSAVHPAHRIHEEYNRIEGNKTPEEHVAFVFNELLASPDWVNVEAELYILGIGDGGDQVIEYLNRMENEYVKTALHSVAALALTGTLPIYRSTSRIPLAENDNFLTFMALRACSWCLSSRPVDTPLANPTPIPELTRPVKEDEEEEEVYLCPRFSGGESINDEAIVPFASWSILGWFDDIRAGGGASGGCVNDLLTISPSVLEEQAAELAALKEAKTGW